MRHLRALAGWLIAAAVLLWRLTCRYRVENDPRPTLREKGTPYLYALLHAHQVAAVFINDEKRLAAMVSRSADGDLLIPSLTVRRVRAVRGSSRSAGRDKGGREALQELGALSARGVPALLAVDGPRGPRNTVHRGVATLAEQARAVILPVVVLPSRRWLLSGTWDRMQLPRPFSTIRLIFAPPIHPDAHDGALQQRVAAALGHLEAVHDPAEAQSTHLHQGPSHGTHNSQRFSAV